MSNKKTKRVETNEDDFCKVRQYIAACPHVSSDHPAIVAALLGLEREQTRRERDAKLQQKFMRDAVTIEKPVAASSGVVQNQEEEERANHHNTNATMTTTTASNHTMTDPDDETMTDDWQDVTTDSSSGSPSNKQLEHEDDAASFLGKLLSKQVVSAIATHNIRVQTPLAAVALALHAAMRTETMGFACTGIPDDVSATSSSTAGGFAAPVRELSKTQFVPKHWDKDDNEVALRYRKNGTGSLVLKVTGQPPSSAASENDVAVEVTLYPTNTGEPPSYALTFSVSEHINLNSWARALREHATVPPALHYKGLSKLLTNFAKTFDLGDIASAATAEQRALPYVDTTIQNLAALQQQQLRQQQSIKTTGGFQPTPPMRPLYANRQPWDNNGNSPTIDSSFPGLRMHDPPGDFAGDLAPGGIRGPGSFGQMDPSQGGSLMGPNHPAFHGGPGMSGVGPNSGMGMRPRFDPFGPPGGPTDPDGIPVNPNIPNNNFNRNRPGGPGDPNPDHLRPPNNLGNNMFM
jgi:hypothetical protein